MKKILIISILVLALSTVLVALPVLANTEEPAYELSDTRVEKGESFSVVLSLKENPGIISLRFKIEYDESALHLDSVQDLMLLGGYSTPSPVTASSYVLRWSVPTAENSSASGELVKLNFTAVSQSETTTEIKIMHVEANTSTGDKVTFADDTAVVEIKEKYSVKFVDEDGTTVLSENKYFMDEPITLPENPIKPTDAENKYIFTAWTPEITETVTQDTVYTAVYEAVPLSDDATLSSLSVNNGTSLSPEFDPNVKEYAVTVDHTVEFVEVLCETSSEFASVAVEEVELRVGSNTVNITVTAEKGNTETYVLSVTKQENPFKVEDNDSTLKELKPSSGVLSPAFDPNKTNYILYVENATTEVFFTCVANSETAKRVSTEDPFAVGDEVVTVDLFCVAETGDKTVYTVKIVKLPAYEDGKIPSFVFPSDDPEDPAEEGSGDGTGNINPPVKQFKISTTTVIIIIALAALFAVAAIIGIVLLVISNKKSAKSYRS